MIIIPAIDLQDGCVVRLVQGRRNKIIYSRDPAKTASHWARQGARLIHVVDLDGASSGEVRNLGAVREIMAKVDVPIEFGGGVRNIETIKSLLYAGIWRVVLGTKAIQDKEFLKKSFQRFQDQIIVSIDAQAGKVFTQGWKKACMGLDALEFAHTLKKIGFKQAIYTDISKDGMLKGPNIQGVKSLAKKSGLEIIASGGISSLADLRRLKALEKQGVTGVIIGKALYEGNFTLTEAIRCAKSTRR